MSHDALRALVRRIRDGLLATEDTVCLDRARLVTEAWRRHEHDPPPLRKARAFAHVLRHMTLDVESNPLFAGNTSSRPRAWMLVPEHGFGIAQQVLIENEGLYGILDDAIPDGLRAFWADRSLGGLAGIGHLAVDYDAVVHRGLEALLDETRQHADDPARRSYREAMAIALEAVIDWASRYADAAARAARSESDPLIRLAHERVAAACRRVPAKPARTLFEGLQAIALTHLALAVEGHGMSISIGLPDRVLEPFISDGFDPDEATCVIGAFMLKITANSVFGRGSLTQPITIGGLDHTGRDRCNALTRCFLDACELVRVGDPHLFLRWHESIDPAVKQRAAELLTSGLSMPLLIHDAPTAQGFLDGGCAPEDAWDYCVIGCNELGIPGRSAESSTASSGTIQHLALLNDALLDHPDPDAIADMPQLLACLEDTMSRHLRRTREGWENHRPLAAERAPTPYTSALMRGCIRRGQDMRVGMDYHLPGLYERGLTNAANALAAIEQLVFETKELTLGEVVEAMRDDFADRLVQERLLAAPKWGNDDECVDRYAVALVEMRERILDALDAELDTPPHFVCHVIRSLHHVDGRRIAASPDGRNAWTPVADSIGAQAGTAVAGPTALLNSVAKLDAARYYRGGYNLNVTLTQRDATPDTVLALIEGFFAENGQELQINCFDAAVLREARDHPDRHPDLVVRFAGFSSRFIDLSSLEQAELIARAESAES